MLVAALAVAGTGAFAAVQARAYDATHPGGGTKATGSEGTTPQRVEGTGEHEGDGEEHEGDGEEHDGHDDHEVTGAGSFNPPATAPADAGGASAAVVSGGS
jgi:hypothetical protein